MAAELKLLSSFLFLKVQMRKISFNQQTFGSIFKLIKYLGYLTKVHTVVEIEGVEQEYFPPSRVIISDKFFRNFSCVSCGACCVKPKYSLAYPPTEYSRIQSEPLSDEIEQKERSVLIKEMLCFPVNITLDAKDLEGVEEDLVSVQHTVPCHLFSNHGKTCSFTRKEGDKVFCAIHKVHTLHCAIPHLQIDRNRKGSARLLKRQYGRNWALGCKSHVVPFDYQRFLTWDLPILQRLLIAGQDFRMCTWLTEIVQYLVNNKDRFAKGDLPKGPIVIYDKKQGIPENYIVKD